MTFQTETARDCTTILRVLVVAFIVVVALWASVGGLDSLIVEHSLTSEEINTGL